MAINIDVFVSNIVAALASFDVVEVQRSVTVDSGPFEFLTKVAPADAATLLGSITGPFTIVGQTLQVKVDSGAQVDVVFTGIDPLTTAQVLDQINTALLATVAFDESNALRLTSTITGTSSKMEVVDGSAAATLGFTAGQRDIGSEEYIDLVTDQDAYIFIDNDGQAGYFYRVRFLRPSTGAVSQWSAPFLGAPGTQVTTASLSLATIDLIDASGQAQAEQKITFYPLNKPLTVEGFSVAIGRGPVTMETDNAGHAEVSLVRGTELRVLFEGTSLIRDIVVPDQTTFNLLGLVEVSPDIYDVVEPNLPAAPRRSI